MDGPVHGEVLRDNLSTAHSVGTHAYTHVVLVVARVRVCTPDRVCVCLYVRVRA